MRLRFYIRDLLWLTLVVALALGLYFEKSHRNDRMKLLEELYEREHGFSIDDRNRLIEGLKALGPEAVEIRWFEHDGFTQYHRNELSALFDEAGWRVTYEKSDRNQPLRYGVKVFIPSTPPAMRNKGHAIIDLLHHCFIDAFPVETDKPGFQIEVGQTFFSP